MLQQFKQLAICYSKWDVTKLPTTGSERAQKRKLMQQFVLNSLWSLWQKKPQADLLFKQFTTLILTQLQLYTNENGMDFEKFIGRQITDKSVHQRRPLEDNLFHQRAEPVSRAAG